MDEIVKTSFVDSCHWSRSLKCDVCFDFYKDPHTLPCGHSYCTCCLIRLAQSIRNLNTNMPLNKVKLHCPTCRQDSVLKPILKDDIAVSFALRDIVDGWKKEKERFGEECCIKLRSVSCQTATTKRVWPSNQVQSLVSQIERHEKIYPNEDYITKALLVTESEESLPDLPVHDNGGTSSSNQPNSTDTDTDSDWENFDNLDDPDENGENGQNEHVGRNEPGGRVLFSPGRLAMTIFWFIYTAMVTFVAHGFLPYMILYTLLFFLILYTERHAR